MTAVYADAGQAKAVYTRLFEQVANDDSGGMETFKKSHMVVKFEMTDPQLDMWVDGRNDPVATAFGTQNLKPNLTLKMSSNTLHEILLGTLPLSKAMSKRKLKVGGSMFKAMKLEALFHSYQADYPQIAKEMLG